MAIEEFTSNGARDFRQRYQGTYGYFTTDSGKRILVFMASVDEYKTTFVDAAGVEYTAIADKGICFEFIPLEKRLFIFEDGLCLASRRPARQWQRGICAANSRMDELSYMIGHDITFKSVKAYDTRVFANSMENLGRQPILINKMMGVSKNLGLYLYNTKIGEVVSSGNKILIRNKAFLQEVIDSTKHLNIEVNA